MLRAFHEVENSQTRLSTHTHRCPLRKTQLNRNLSGKNFPKDLVINMFKRLKEYRDELEGDQGGNSKTRIGYIKTRNLLLL